MFRSDLNCPARTYDRQILKMIVSIQCDVFKFKYEMCVRQLLKNYGAAAESSFGSLRIGQLRIMLCKINELCCVIFRPSTRNFCWMVSVCASREIIFLKECFEKSCLCRVQLRISAYIIILSNESDNFSDDQSHRIFKIFYDNYQSERVSTNFAIYISAFDSKKMLLTRTNDKINYIDTKCY